jgi:hypothetical protein
MAFAAPRVVRRAQLHSTVVRASYENDNKVRAEAGAMRQPVGRGQTPLALAPPPAAGSSGCAYLLTPAFGRCSLVQGAPDSLEYRIFFKQQKDGAVVSPWHDIPLFAGVLPALLAPAVAALPILALSQLRSAQTQPQTLVILHFHCHIPAGNGTFNFVCEIPKETSAKMEVATVSVAPAADCIFLPPCLPPVLGGPLPDCLRACAPVLCPPAVTALLRCLSPHLQPHHPTCVQDETSTPIKQDIKKGALRFYPYNINWNYGLLPQVGAARVRWALGACAGCWEGP